MVKRSINHQETQAPASSPGTTPLVAMALIEMAVSIVCKERQLFQEMWAPRFSNMLSLRLQTSDLKGGVK